MKIKKTYQGAVPLNRISAQEDNSELNTYSTAYINNLKENSDQAIDELKQQNLHDYIIIGLSQASIPISEDGAWVTVGFGSIVKQSGSKLSASLPGVKVGAGVKKVRIYGQVVVYEAPDNKYAFLGIRINNNMVAKTIHQVGQWMSISLDWVAEVKENDIIDMAMYKEANEESYYLQDFVNFTKAPCNYLLVEAIE